MSEKENLVNEEVESKEVGMIPTATNVIGFGDYQSNSKTERQTLSTIKDPKKLFNLENKVDYKINECKGEKIRVKDVLIKKFITPLEIPETDENGEITKEFDVKIVTILVDDQDKSYVTASKLFYFDIMKLIGMYGSEFENVIKNGIEIKITDKPVSNSGNKALTFELV